MDMAKTKTPDDQADPKTDDPGKQTDKQTDDAGEQRGSNVVRMSDGKKFLDAFGDTGARWFLQGKSFEEAQKLHADELKERTEELTEENAQLKQKLAAVDRGEDEPADFQSAEEGPDAKRVTRFSQNLGDNLGRVAAATRMPGQNGNH